MGKNSDGISKMNEDDITCHLSFRQKENKSKYHKLSQNKSDY